MGGGSSKGKDKPSALAKFRGAGKAMKKKFLSTIDEVDEPVSKMSYVSQVSQTNLLESPSEPEKRAFPGEDSSPPAPAPAAAGKPAPMVRQYSGTSNS